jgi:dihydroxyacetone kinase
MTHLFNDPAEFRTDAMEGFSAAYSRYVDRVPGASGFVRHGGPLAGKVSLVVGGGSGHYPSYGGIVGLGFADGCVLGDVFTSPSTEQIYRVAKAAHGGAGLILAFGNYAGDRLNFGAARERLVAEGIDTRIVFVTDDVASAPPEEVDKRRGIAGTFAVYKSGGAAADSGASIDEVERLMRLANSRTYSFGVAFAGCTFPGKQEPLFTVDAGRMELGLGIHGEPGIQSEAWMRASELADKLVDKVLGERPADSDERAAVLVNGLGATKYEELFLLYGQIHRRLADAGVVAVLPEVGEMVTSLDMAGCSLSITWLDDELEALWAAPADTVAFRRGDATVSGEFDEASPEAPAVESHTTDSESSASAASIAAAVGARRALIAARDVLIANEDFLGKMDSVAGDGDHGVGMTRGIGAAVTAAGASSGGVGTLMRAAGDAFGDKAGGTSGMLWGVFLRAIGDSLGDTDPVDASGVARAMKSGLEALQRIGGAEVGDKTMIDALVPFVAELTDGVESGVDVAYAWADAAKKAVEAAAETADLVARVGRARPLGARSVGTPDPGATSMGLVLTAVQDAVAAIGSC